MNQIFIPNYPDIVIVLDSKLYYAILFGPLLFAVFNRYLFHTKYHCFRNREKKKRFKMNK